MDLTNYILPYPFEAYKGINKMESFNDYRKRIYDWVDKHTSNIDIEKENIEKMFSLVEPSDQNNAAKQWMLKHIDKLRYIYDFSGLAFGIVINEKTEDVWITFPYYINEDDRILYPGYDEISFKSMNMVEKLEWMYTYCEFIPFCVAHEYIDLSSSSISYKYSHIKRDYWAMKMLDTYLNDLKYQPSDNVYYFIKFNSKTRVWYLKRDLEKSPKRK